MNKNKGIYYFAMMSTSEKRRFREERRKYANRTLLDCYNFSDYMNQNYINFSTFISSAFTWSDTKQGDNYWFKFANRY